MHPRRHGIAIRRWGSVLGLVAVSLLLAEHGTAAATRQTAAHPTVTAHDVADDPTVVSLPPSINADCSVADSTATLENWLNSLPADSSVEFPTDGCFFIQGSLWLHNTVGLTINGNGSVFAQSVPGPASAPVHPIVYLTQDSDLIMKNLTIGGAYDETNGGVSYEGDFGLLLEADQHVTLDRITVENIQGDCIDINAPDSGVTGTDGSLNSDVFVTDSTFHDCGYHGVTIESADGTAFSHDDFSDIGTDAMDFEYGTYSTGFENGQPWFAAEDNIHIIDDTWDNFGGDWFASLQRQSPGVQEQNVTLSGNTIDSPSPLLEVAGTDQTQTTSQYWDSGLTVTDNTATQPAYPTQGGSILDPFVGSAMTIQDVSDVDISDNTFPLYDGQPGYFPDTSYMAAVEANGVNGLTIQSNTFDGALGVLHPSSGDNSAVATCGNLYGVDAALLDSSCPDAASFRAHRITGGTGS